MDNKWATDIRLIPLSELTIQAFSMNIECPTPAPVRLPSMTLTPKPEIKPESAAMLRRRLPLAARVHVSRSNSSQHGVNVTSREQGQPGLLLGWCLAGQTASEPSRRRLLWRC